MVALQILVLPVEVRVLVGQPPPKPFALKGFCFPQDKEQTKNSPTRYLGPP